MTSQLLEIFDEHLLPHMKQQAASACKSLGRSLDEITVPRLRDLCDLYAFARRWIEECCPERGVWQVRVGCGCDPLPIEDMEYHYTHDEQGQTMFDLNLLCFGIAGDGECFSFCLETGKVFLMFHQWRIEEQPFESWISQQWPDIPAFLEWLKQEGIANS